MLTNPAALSLLINFINVSSSVSISSLFFGLFDDLLLPTVCRLKIKLQIALSLTLKILPSLPNHFSLARLPLLS